MPMEANMEPIKFKDILKGIMDYYGWSQIEFSDHYNLSPSQVYRWLNGQEPRASIYAKFLNIFNNIQAEA